MDVGHYQAEASVHLSRCLQRRRPVLGLDDAKPGLDEHAREQPSEQLLIVDQQNGGP
jgi:ABC-type thiamine transport system ATPase subunit